MTVYVVNITDPSYGTLVSSETCLNYDHAQDVFYRKLAEAEGTTHRVNLIQIEGRTRKVLESCDASRAPDPGVLVDQWRRLYESEKANRRQLSSRNRALTKSLAGHVALREAVQYALGDLGEAVSKQNPYFDIERAKDRLHKALGEEVS